ncbi:protoporphyrinogen oxidase [Isoptericola sp. b490]|uniref:protoporphyrinogen oxidase n=1 Tax=Actinotalea lenta TaxID=3064654 RepID=UPI002713228B|nr:protoporphyrinogen oxidase [Isoptericola sp. b490]MDO8122601.1 protoporphyrinogen oxidase [Isoptericola sp. b490]
MTRPFLVVGAGITGLAAAFELAGSGHDVVLVERDRLGGRIRTERIDGFLIEHGPDSFVAYRPGAVRLADALGIGDDVVPVVPPRSVHLRVHGRMEPMPAGMGMVLPTRIGPFARTRILSWPQKLRAVADLVMPRVLGPQDMAIGALLRRRVGPGVVARFADPLVGGIYGASVDDLSIDAVLPMLRDYERKHRSLVLASLAQGRTASRPGDPEGSPFRSMRGGMGQLVDALVAALDALGVQPRVGVSVLSLAPSAEGARAALSDGTELEVAGVVLAGGAPSSADLLAEIAPDAARTLRQVRYGSTRSVHLAYDEDAFDTPPTGHGYLEAGPERTPVTGVTLASRKWPGRAPDGSVLVRAFVPDRVGAAASLGDDDLLDTVAAHVGRVLGATRSPRLRHLVRWTDAMPTYTVGHRSRARSVSDALAHTPVRVAGSALNGVGVPDCITDGRRLAAELATQMVGVA